MIRRQNPASQTDATLDSFARYHRRTYFASVHARAAARVKRHSVMQRYWRRSVRAVYLPAIESNGHA